MRLTPFVLAATLCAFAFVPLAAANPIDDVQCGSVGGCCPTALSCICGSSTVVGCIEKIVVLQLPPKPTVCDELTGQYCGPGKLVCVTEGTERVCLPDPCYTTACF